MMLALLIAMAATALGINAYKRYQADNNVRQLNATVDQLFQGLSMYYQANCRDTNIDSTGNIISHTGSMDPRDTNNSPTIANPFPMSIKQGSSSLVNAGFIATVAWPPINNPLVDVAYGENGFSIQFDGMTSTPTSVSGRMPVATFNNWVGPSTPIQVGYSQDLTPAQSGVGTIYVWQAHVVVKLVDSLLSISPDIYTSYAGRLGASCSSNTPTLPCSSATTTGPYIIWERLPSMASNNTRSSLFVSMPNVRSFTNLYYTDDVYSASNPVNWGNANNNYLCGG